MDQLRELAAKEIKADEGIRFEPYRDTLGNWTIGIGHLMENQNQDMTKVHWTVEQVEAVFQEDLEKAIEAACQFIRFFERLPFPVQLILVNMAFNLGLPKLLKFKRFKQALLNKNYQLAAVEMLLSKWAEQVPKRAQRLAERMRKVL